MADVRDKISLQNQKKLTAHVCLSIVDNTQGVENYIDRPDFNVNLKTNAGYSPLYYAIKKGNVSVFNKLIQKGAVVSESYDNLTLRDIVKQQMALADLRNDKGLARNLEIIDKQLEAKKINFNDQALQEFNERIKIPSENTTQTWIKYPLKVSGYQHKSEGYCNGLAHMGVQALVLENRDEENNLVHLKKYSKRMQHLANMPDNDYLFRIDLVQHKRRLLFESAKTTLENLKILSEGGLNIDIDLRLASISKEDFKKILADNNQQQLWLENRVNSQLSNSEKMDLDILPVLDGIELYQQIYKHNELLQKKDATSRQEIIPVMPIVESTALEKEGGLVIVNTFSKTYDDDSLLRFLNELKETVIKNNYTSPVAIQLSANNHAITIGFDPAKKQWIMIDANIYLKQIIDNVNGANNPVTSFNNDDIFKNEIKERLLAKDKKQLTIEGAFFATAAQCQSLKEKVTDPLKKSITEKSTKNKGFFSRHKKAIVATGLIIVGAGLIAGSIMTAGLLPVAIASFALAATGAVIGAGAMYGGIGSMLNSALNNYKKNEESRKIKKLFKQGVKRGKKLNKEKRKQHEEVELQTLKQPSAMLASVSSSTNIIHQELNIEKINTAHSPSIDPVIATSTASANSIDERILEKSYIQCMQEDKENIFLDKLFSLSREDQIKVLLQNQSDSDIIKIYLQSTSSDKYLSKMFEIDNIKLLIKPYDKLNDPNDRDQFRKEYLKLPDNLKQMVIEKFQSSENAINRLKESFAKYNKPLVDEIARLDKYRESFVTKPPSSFKLS